MGGASRPTWQDLSRHLEQLASSRWYEEVDRNVPSQLGLFWELGDRAFTLGRDSQTLSPGSLMGRGTLKSPSPPTTKRTGSSDSPPLG